ncbi:MAG: VPLPA-CTERM sorting domain-containing protein [Gammaproteobacteria bacterium]|nr:VPLPA-CTERM sorting domain-containing protein [Gammaproteobacteria bacterium]MBU2478995.1 VPLPA-CTERM sorting domain-containing protein [Gammaproteobacteria bacterium]
MVNNNKANRPGIRAALSSALFLVATSASAVTVDGDLTDIMFAVSSSPYNKATALDPMGSSDSPTTESNNGFDIQNVYSFYDVSLDTLYLGMSVYGTVGDSRAINDITSCGSERTQPSCLTLPSTNRSIFDSNETYGFSLFKGTSINDPGLLGYTVVGADNGTDSGSFNGGLNPYSLIVDYKVSESFNGVEFSITGLNAPLSPFSFTNPADLLILFKAGSADLNSASTGAEDSHLLQMQVVPVPAAAWLLGSGLVGLIGLARRQRSSST